MGWIIFLRVFTWILFGLICLGSVISGIAMFDLGDEGLLMGLGVIVGGVLGGFLLIATTMIYLNNASNLNKIATNSAEILELLKRK